MNVLANMARSAGDPKIITSGPSSLTAADRVARDLGWFSIALGLTELVGARSVARTLGMEGSEGMIRAFGAREIASGIVSLSVEKQLGLWSRVAGDGLDIIALIGALDSDNPKRGNVGLALLAVLGITVLDVSAAKAVSARHRPDGAARRNYADRSGFPRGNPNSGAGHRARPDATVAIGA